MTDPWLQQAKAQAKAHRKAMMDDERHRRKVVLAQAFIGAIAAALVVVVLNWGLFG